MLFTQLLTLENIRQGITCASKKRTFEIIGQILAPEADIPVEHEESECQEDDIVKEKEICCTDCLFTREKIGNSALGNGIAMPKGRLPQGTKPLAAFLQLTSGVDYDAPDHRDVDLILAILIPNEMCAEFSTKLQEIAKRLVDKTLCKKLRAAQSAEEIWQAFKESDIQYLEQATFDPDLEEENQDTTEETETLN
ncbi:PTS transporter subunit IIA-like nitrogen-regulatory protein PtsN [Actinobacillus delphinicola]|uniref:PTS transporter subunit IIA-like nitrogen-regulatory protein PtsN n=1 Tax=Actinobacillus delphinicola TaxID=51161 RepID=A0A448TVY2_9PAST|nr:PTS transporter subunit IIA-like nitrogen-regulatory protein PtsN [Actinobacillus delphinicola]